MNFSSTSQAIREELQRLVGCSWGRVLASDDDMEPCMELASRIAVVYQDDKQAEVRLCPKHMSMLFEESTPHEFDDEDM